MKRVRRMKRNKMKRVRKMRKAGESEGKEMLRNGSTFYWKTTAKTTFKVAIRLMK